ATPAIVGCVADSSWMPRPPSRGCAATAVALVARCSDPNCSEPRSSCNLDGSAAVDSVLIDAVGVMAGGVMAGGCSTNSPRQLGQAIVCPANAADVAIGRLQNGQFTAIRIALLLSRRYCPQEP